MEDTKSVNLSFKLIYHDNMIRYAVESGLQTQEEAESYFNLQSYMIQSIIATPVMRLATSAIVAIFTRKK